MPTQEVRCECASAICNHNGKRCEKPVTVKLKTSYLLGASKESPERNTGICDDCFNAAKKALPHVFA